MSFPKIPPALKLYKLMSVIVRLAKLEDQQRCSELLNVLAKVTSDSHEIFDTETFKDLISSSFNASGLSQ